MALGNSGSRLLGNTEFYGGLSTDRKIGIENSYYDGECLEVRHSPSQMSVLPMSRELQDENVIKALPVAMTQIKSGDIWMVDEKGTLYRIDAWNNVEKHETRITSSGFGLENYELTDGLWFSDGDSSLCSYGPLSRDSRQTNYFSAFDDESEYIASSIYIQKNNGQTFYQSDPSRPRDKAPEKSGKLLNWLSEAPYRKILFLPGVPTIRQIGVRFVSLGNNDGEIWLVVHDEANNVVGESKRRKISSLRGEDYSYFDMCRDPIAKEGADNELTAVPWSGDTLEAGSVYHIHVLTSDQAGDNRIATWADGDMNLGADIRCKGAVLTRTHNHKHPMSVYDKLYIGNGKYVASLDNSPLTAITDTLYRPNALRLDDGFEVCSFGSSDEYLIIGAEKFSTEAKRGFQAGRIYFWDRLSESYNFFIDCPMGSPKSIFNYGNIAYVIIEGALYAYTGGKELVRVRTLKGVDADLTGRNTITEVYPNMMACRRDKLMVGFPSYTNSDKIRFGVHSWGSVDKNFPNCFTYDYRVPVRVDGQTIPQYNSDTQKLRIGCVYNFGDSLFYGYEREANGVKDVALAVVDNKCGTSDSFIWKSLQYDAGAPALEKDALRVGIYFDPLPEGTEITPIYRIDNGEWQRGPVSAKAGDRYITCEVNKRVHEFQYGFEGKTSNRLETPVIKQVGAEIRVLNEEQKL